MRFQAILLSLLLSILAASPGECQSSSSGDITASGTTCATTNACISLAFPVSPGLVPAVATVSLTGTFTATLRFEQSADKGGSWVSATGSPAPSGGGATSATTTGTWTFQVAAMTSFRVRASSYTSGTVTVSINTSPSGGSASPYANGQIVFSGSAGAQTFSPCTLSSVPPGTHVACTSGSAVFFAGDLGRKIQIPLAGASQTSPAPATATIQATITAIDADGKGVTIDTAATTTATAVQVVWGADVSSALASARDACPTTAGLVAPYTSLGCQIIIPTGTYMLGSGVVFDKQNSFQILGLGAAGQQSVSSAATAGVRFVTAMPIKMLTIGPAIGVSTAGVNFILSNIVFQDVSLQGEALGGVDVILPNDALFNKIGFYGFNGRQAGPTANVLSFGVKVEASTDSTGGNRFSNWVTFYDLQAANNSVIVDASGRNIDGPRFVGGDLFPNNSVSNGQCVGVVTNGFFGATFLGTHVDVGQGADATACVGVRSGGTISVDGGKFESSGAGGGTAFELVGGSTAANAAVSVTRASNGVTATLTAHPYAVNQVIAASACGDTSFNGVFPITSTAVNSFTWDQTGAGATTTCTLTGSVSQGNRVYTDIGSSATIGVLIDTGSQANRVNVYCVSTVTTCVSPTALTSAMGEVTQIQGSGATNSSYALPYIVTIRNQATTEVPLTINSQGSTTANLQDWNNGGTNKTSVTSNGDYLLRRIRANKATAQVAGDWALGAGWGTSPSVSSVTAVDHGGRVQITAGTGTPAANPTLALTFKDGTWGTAPACHAGRGETNAPTTATWNLTTISATAATWTFVGTPTISTAYILDFTCMGK